MCSSAGSGRRLLHAISRRDGERKRGQQCHRVRDDRAADQDAVPRLTARTAAHRARRRGRKPAHRQVPQVHAVQLQQRMFHRGYHQRSTSQFSICSLFTLTR